MAETIRKDLPDTPLRLAFTVPGVLHVEKSPTQIDADKALDSFKVNSLGPLLLMKHLSPFLPNKSANLFPDSVCRMQPRGVPSCWRIPTGNPQRLRP